MSAYLEDTIAAIATAPGPAAIAIVRLSGPRARALALEILRQRRDLATPPALDSSHRAQVCAVVNPSSNRVIDEALVLPMFASRSFTGEDVVEIHCHGGHLLPTSILQLLIRAGARAARPGEFSLRAFLNGRLDLSQAEAIIDLIESSSERAASLACDQLRGSLGRATASLTDRIADLRALVEASLDFPDEDLPADLLTEISAGVATLDKEAEILAETYDRGRVTRDGLRVVLTGRANVGKSSLLNRLVGKDRALVSELAGTTRDYIEESATLGGLQLLLYDTAGIRRAEDTIESAGIQRSRELSDSADLVVLVMDGSEPLTEDDLSAFLATTGKPRLVVRNKADLPSVAHSSWTEVFPPEERGSLVATIPASSRAPNGIEALATSIQAAIRARLAVAEGGHSEGVSSATLTSARQHQAVLDCVTALEDAKQALNRGVSLDLVASELQRAQVALAEVTGLAGTAEEILDRVFSRFCLGK